MEVVAVILTALGFAGAAGLNGWIPLLVTVLAARSGTLELSDSLDGLTSNTALGLVSAGLVIDFVSDKVPAVDHVMHIIGGVVQPASGAVVAAAQAGADVPPIVLALAGAATAGSIHAGRAVVRPASNTLTAGLGNPVLSLAEDVGSVALSVLAIVAPLLAVLLLVAVVVLVLRAALRSKNHLTAAAAGPPARRP